MSPRTKRALSRRFEKYVVNPQLRFAVRHGIAPGNFALLETTGRRSGRPRCIPVGNGLRGDTFWLVAGVASPLREDGGLGRRRRLDHRHGLRGRIDGAIFRAIATQPLTIRIDLK